MRRHAQSALFHGAWNPDRELSADFKTLRSLSYNADPASRVADIFGAGYYR
jgi:hypothetical protein